MGIAEADVVAAQSEADPDAAMQRLAEVAMRRSLT